MIRAGHGFALARAIIDLHRGEDRRDASKSCLNGR